VDCEAGAAEAPVSKNDPLDGSVSGTIGGGGPDTGGSTERPNPPDMPAVNPDDAASGRRAPDPLGATTDPKPLPVEVDITTHDVPDDDDGMSQR
jgi:hypothetical protein